MVELISQKKGPHSSTNQTSLRNLGLFELYSDKVSNMLPGNLAAWVTTHIGIGRTSFDSAGGSQPAKVPKVFCTSASHSIPVSPLSSMFRQAGSCQTTAGKVAQTGDLADWIPHLAANGSLI